MEGADTKQEAAFDATFIEQPAILDKYKAAAVISDAALEKAISLSVVDADVNTICGAVDDFIQEELLKVFSNKKSKKLDRGIAFPTCLSVNEIMGHFSPIPDDSRKLVVGDLVKIELGCHIDGFAGQVAHTVIVGGKSEGRQADAVLAAHAAFRAAARTIKVGALNQTVTENIALAAKQFNVNPVQGVLSHKTKKHLIDGNECIINFQNPEQRVEDWEFAAGDVIGLDVYVSTGEGMGKESDIRTTVYKREMDAQYSLKSKHARAFFSIVNKSYPTLPFSIRGFEDLTGAKVGIKECVEHDLLMGFPVLTEKVGEFVAQFKGTIVVQPKSTAILCGGRDLANADGFTTENSVKDADLVALLAKDLWKEEKVKKAKK